MDFLARHAVAVLIAFTIAALAVSALVWHGITTYGPRAWSAAIRLWERAHDSPFTHRLRRAPLLGRGYSGAVGLARYFGAVAMVGFVLSAGAVVLFFEVADEIGVGESLERFDIALTAALREHVSRETLHLFAIITRLGDGEVLAVVGAVVFASLAISGRRLLAFAWLATTLSGGLLNRTLKAIFERSRPLHDHGLTAEVGWSFPSGHASGSMLVYGLLAYVIVRHTAAIWHIPVALSSIALIIFIGSSRVLLQVHYLSDVLAGYVVAAAWLAICVAALEAVRWRDTQRSSLAPQVSSHD